MQKAQSWDYNFSLVSLYHVLLNCSGRFPFCGVHYHGDGLVVAPNWTGRSGRMEKHIVRKCLDSVRWRRKKKIGMSLSMKNCSQDGFPHYLFQIDRLHILLLVPRSQHVNLQSHLPRGSWRFSGAPPTDGLSLSCLPTYGGGGSKLSSGYKDAGASAIGLRGKKCHAHRRSCTILSHSSRSNSNLVSGSSSATG
jgi:hypothetical protein